MEPFIVFVAVLAVTFGGGFLMDRERWENFNPLYLVEYGLLALPLFAGYMSDGLPGVGEVALTYVLLLIALYAAATMDWHTTFVPTGEIKFVVRGETLERVLENVEGYYVDYDPLRCEWVMVSGEKPDQYEPFITRWFGIYWVSLLFPLKRVHTYTFDWTKLFAGMKPSEEKGSVETVSEESKYYLQHRHEEVNSIYFRYAYPVVAVQIEIKGNLMITLTALITTEVINPAKPVFLYKGNWLEPVMSAVRDAMAGFVRKLNIDEVREGITKGSDAAENLERFILRTVSADLQENVGIDVVKVDFIRYDLAAYSTAERNAMSAKEIARLEAEANIERGRGEGERERLKLAGRAAGLGAIASATGGDPAVRAHVVAAQMHQEAVAGFQGNVLSLGGAGTPVLVSADTSGKGGKEKEPKGA